MNARNRMLQGGVAVAGGGLLFALLSRELPLQEALTTTTTVVGVILAFVAVMLQLHELRMQREELKLQREVLKGQQEELRLQRDELSGQREQLERQATLQEKHLELARSQADAMAQQAAESKLRVDILKAAPLEEAKRVTREEVERIRQNLRSEISRYEDLAFPAKGEASKSYKCAARMLKRYGLSMRDLGEDQFSKTVDQFVFTASQHATTRFKRFFESHGRELEESNPDLGSKYNDWAVKLIPRISA